MTDDLSKNFSDGEEFCASFLHYLRLSSGIITSRQLNNDSGWVRRIIGIGCVLSNLTSPQCQLEYVIDLSSSTVGTYCVIKKFSQSIYPVWLEKGTEVDGNTNEKPDILLLMKTWDCKFYRNHLFKVKMVTTILA